MTSKSTLIRSDQSMLTIALLEDELNYRAEIDFLKDEKKFLEEKIRCTACDSLMKNVFTRGDVSFHPSFEVIICKGCEKFYASGEFSVDEDGSDEYCRWCGQGGNLYCCSSCSVAICEKCVKINFPKNSLQEIEDDDWKCFLCHPKPIWPHRAVAAAVRNYLAKYKFDVKNKRHYSDDSDCCPSKVKRARKNSSPGESKIVIDPSDESDTVSQAKSSEVKKDGLSSHKSSKKGVIIISDDEEDDDTVTDRSKRKESKKKQKSKKNYASDPEEESKDENEKPRRISRKSRIDYKEENVTENVDSRRKSKKPNSKKPSCSSSTTSRRSKKTVTDDDESNSDRSVFRDEGRSKTSSRKSQVKSKSSAATRQKESSESYELMSRDAVKIFQQLLKQSLKAIDKLVDITVNHADSFRREYINEKEYLLDYDDVGVAKEKYLAFLRHLVNSTKRIEKTFFDSVDPLISSADSQKAMAKRNSSPSPVRKSSGMSKLFNGVASYDSGSGSEEKVEKKSSSKIEVDDELTKSQNITAGLTDIEETSSLASSRKSVSTNRKDADNENHASSPSSEANENSKESKREKSSSDASMTNNVDKISAKIEGNVNDETAITDTGVSDSMIVNVGTEDESVVSEQNFRAESSKEKSNNDDDLPEKSDNKNWKRGKSEGEKKSVIGGNFYSLDTDDVDGGGDNSSTVNDKSKEEFAKNDLLQNSENSSEDETDKYISSDEAKKKHDPENDRTLLSRSPSCNKSLEIDDSKEKRAESDILNESDENDDKNSKVKSKDIIDDNSNEDIAKSKEKNAKKKLLESSDSSANDCHSKSSSDSGMSGVDLLQKKSDNKKSV